MSILFPFVNKKLWNNMRNEMQKYYQSINNSKIFAGLVVITLNIASRFVNIKLSKSLENYLKYTFSRNILIFCISWMGSREIYIALIITLLFILFADILFNEKSKFYILPETFQTIHNSLDNVPPTDIEIKEAYEILERAKTSKDTSKTITPIF
jgi:hypothetical protein